MSVGELLRQIELKDSECRLVKLTANLRVTALQSEIQELERQVGSVLFPEPTIPGLPYSRYVVCEDDLYHIERDSLSSKGEVKIRKIDAHIEYVTPMPSQVAETCPQESSAVHTTAGHPEANSHLL